MTGYTISSRTWIGVWLALMVIFSPIVGSVSIVGVASGTTTDNTVNSLAEGDTAIQPEISFSNDTIVSVSDNLSVWGLGIWPLRTDSSDAVHSSSNIFTWIDTPQGGASLNKDTVDFYPTGESISLTYSPERAPVSPQYSDFDGEHVQLVAARVQPDSNLPNSMDGLSSFIQNNATADYTMVVEEQLSITNQDPTHQFSFTPDRSGQYVLFLADPEDGTTGFTVTDGNITQTGNVTLIGMDVVMAQKGLSGVSTPDETATTGERVPFSVNASALPGDETTNHLIALYDNQTLQESSQTIVISNLSGSPDLSYETTIKKVNGEFVVENNPRAFGKSLKNRNVTRPLDPVSFIDTFAGGAITGTSTGDIVLNASATAKKSEQKGQISVGIPDNWTAGSYHWIHIAMTNSSGELMSNSGDLEVAKGVNLNLTPNTSAIEPGDDVEFTLTREDTGEPVNGTLSVDDETIAINGSATYTFDSLGTYTVTASKPKTADTTFIEDTETIEVLEPANLSVTDAQATKTEAYVSEDVPVEVTVENTGGFAGDLPINLTNSTGHVLASDTVTVDANSTQSFTLTTAFDTTGDKKLAVNGVPAGTVTILPAVTVTDYTVNSTITSIDRPISVNATIENNGDITDNITVTLVVDGVDVASEPSGDLAPGRTTYVEFEHKFESLGGHSVTVQDPNIGTLYPTEVTVSRQKVQLNVTPNRTTAKTNAPITFTVTRENDSQPVEGAVVEVGDVIGTTDSDGNVTLTLGTGGTFTATANKEETDTLAYEEATADVTYNAPADVSVVDVSPLATQTFSGNEITFEVTVQNAGDLEGNITIDIGFQGVNKTREVSVPGRETQAESFTFTAGPPGTETAIANGTSSDAVTISKAVRTTDFVLGTTSLIIGENLTVEAAVENRGQTSQEETVNLTVDGDIVATETETVPAGTTQTVSLTWDTTGTTVGTKEIAVEGLAPKTLTIEPETVGLHITASPQTTTLGETIEFNVTYDNGTAVENANVTVAGKTLTTDEFGLASTAIDEPDTYRVRATKPDTDTTTFLRGSTTVTVKEPADLDVDATLTQDEAFTRDDIPVEVAVTNNGGVEGTTTVKLNNSTGHVLDQTTISVGPGSTETVTLLTSFDEPGEQELFVNGTSVGTVTINPQTVVTDVSFNRTAVTTADSGIAITATVTNLGQNEDPDGTTVSFTVENADDASLDTKSPISSGGTDTVTHTVSFDLEGVNSVLVDGTAVGTITVSESVEDLSIEANETEVIAGTPIQFNVTNETGEPVDATIDVAGETRTTGENGQATVIIEEGGNYTAIATKAPTDGTAYNSSSVEVTVNDPADIVVTDAFRYQSRAYTNDNVTVQALVKNLGDELGTKTINLTNTSGGVLNSTEVKDLAGDQSVTITLNATFDTQGPRELFVGDQSAGTVQIAPQTIVTGFTVNETIVDVGNAVSVEANISNRGSTDDSFEVELLQDGAEVDNQTVTVTAGSTTTATFTPTLSEVGDVYIAVNDRPSTQVTVTQEIIDLSVSVNPAPATTGETVTFTVTDSGGDPVDGASITAGDQTLSTNSNGNATASFAERGLVTARVTKESTDTKTFNPTSATFEVRSPANIRITDARVTTSGTVVVGDDVDVSVTLVNTGGVSGSETVSVTNTDGDSNDTTVTVDPGRTKSVTLTTNVSSTGLTTFNADGETAGIVDVEPAVVVTDYDVSSTAVLANETVRVLATVENRGDTNASIDVPFYADGEEVTKPTLTVAAGDTETKEFSTSFETEGLHNVSVANLPETWIDVVLNSATLRVTANTSSVVAGQPVEFTVVRTDTDNPVEDATVRVGDQQRTTASDGTVTLNIRTAGTYPVVATKERTGSTAFARDTTTLTVTDPLTITDSLDFGTVTASPQQGSDRASSAVRTETVTVTNDGGRTVSLGQATIIGTDATQFGIVSQLPSSVAPGDSVDVTVRFAPTVRDSADATVRFRSNTPKTPTRTVSLSGTGEAPAISVNTTRVAFGDVGTGSQATETVLVENNGEQALVVNAQSMAAGFSSTPGSLEIAPGNNSTIDVTFDPSAPQRYGDRLTLVTNDPFNETVSVRAIGTGQEGELLVSPSDQLALGDVTQDSTASADILLENTGTDTITVTPNETDDAAGEFTVESEGSAITLAPAESTFVTVEVTPTSDSPSANVTFESAGLPDQTVQLTASGLTPTALISPDPSGDDPDVNYGSVAVGGSSTQEVIVTNTGDADLEVDLEDALPSDVPYEVAGSTGTRTVAPGNQISISVVFEPTTTGTSSANLTFDTNDPNNATVDVALAGSGETTSLEGDTGSLDFGKVGVGAADTLTVQLTNDGTEELSRLRVNRKTGSDSGAFQAIDGLESPLAPDDSTNVTIEFEPEDAGSKSASMTFAANGETTGESTFTLSLSGGATPPVATVSSETLRFGFVDVQDDPETETLQLTNDGLAGTSLAVESVSITGSDAYNVTSAPTGETIAGGDTLDIGVEYDPEPPGGEDLATLQIETSDPTQDTIEVELLGVGSAPNATVDRPSIAFGEVQSGTTTEPTVVEVTNDGGALLSLDALNFTAGDGGQFQIADGIDRAILVPGASEQISIEAAPDTTGDVSATLTVETSADTDPTISVSATGIAPSVNVTDDLDADFGGVNVGSSARTTLTVANDGNATLVLDPPTIRGSSASAFTVVSGTGEKRLGPGESTTYAVAFSPSDDSTDQTADLEITTNDGDITRSLSGDGQAADASLSPSSVDFGDVRVGETDNTTLTLSNSGGAQLQITGISVTGDDSAAFTVSGLSTGSLAAGDDVTFTVETSPSVTGSLSATLEIDTETQGTITASLGATGVEQEIELSTQSVTFDRTRLGTITTSTILVENTGNAPLKVSSLEIAGANADQFEVAGDTLTIPAKDSAEIEVAFTPPTSDADAAKNDVERTATLVVDSDDPDEGTVTVELAGTGKTPELTVADAVQFGSTGDTSTRTLTITNDVNASASIDLSRVLIGGDANNEFATTEPGQRTLDPGESTTITLSLTPKVPGPKFASLSIITNDPRQPGKSVFLSNSETIVTVEFGSVHVSYENIDPGLLPEREFRRNLDTDAAVIATQPYVQTSQDFELVFEGQADAFGGKVVESNAIDPIRYLSATKNNISDAAFTNNTFTFRVSKAALAEEDADPSDVELYRYDGSKYVPVAGTTTQVDEEQTDYIYEATVESFSTFAIVVGQPDIVTTPGSLDRTEILTNESTTASATITNNGAASGSKTVALTVDGTTQATQTVTLGPDEEELVEFDVAPGVAGDFDIAIDGQSIGTLTVTEPEEEEEEEPTAPGPGAPTQPTQPTQPPQEAEVTVSVEGTTVTVTITAAAGQGVDIQTNVTAGGPAEPQIDAMNVRFTEAVEDTSMSITGDRGDAPPVHVDHDLGYFNLQHDFTDEQVGEVTFNFSVDQSRLEDRGVAPEDIVLYRYSNDKWTALDTQQIGSTETEYRFQATSPGLSVFAVSTEQAQQADIQVIEAEITDETVTVGDEVGVTATVENLGSASGTKTIELRANEEVLDTEDVTLDAGESTQITLTATMDQVGEFELDVDGTIAGTVSVQEPVTTTTTEKPPTTAQPEEPGIPPLVWIVVFLLLLGILGWYLYREGYFENW